MLPNPDTLHSAITLPTDTATSASTAENANQGQWLTVRRVLSWLPPTASEWKRDSMVQRYFPNQHMEWLPDAEPYLPIGKSEVDNVGPLELKVFKSKALGELSTEIMEVPYRPQGIGGDPVPYRFRDDNFVTSTLMLSFFLAVWVIARSWHFLRNATRNFFFESKVRENMFTARTDRELRGQIFLIFVTCFLLSILFLGYTQTHLKEVFVQVSPYIILGTALVLCTSFYGLKVLLYMIVNNTLFDKHRTSQWTDAYMLYILFLGLLLLPITLLFVFFDIPIDKTTLFVAFVYLLGKLLLLYKCLRIFFYKKGGFFHLILYFCTLEIIPALALWRVLVYVSQILITYI